jgi:hypothetical protein
VKAAPASRKPLYALLYEQAWLAFVLMGLSFVLFGVATLNLLYIFRAAWEFLVMHGWDAVREGVLMQMAELVLSGYLAAAFYVLFKVCEKALVERVSRPRGN